MCDGHQEPFLGVCWQAGGSQFGVGYRQFCAYFVASGGIRDLKVWSPDSHQEMMIVSYHF